MTLHARERAVQRIGLELCDDDIDYISNRVADGTFFVYKPLHHGTTSYMCCLRGVHFVIIVGSNNVIRTVYSVEMARTLIHRDFGAVRDAVRVRGVRPSKSKKCRRPMNPNASLDDPLAQE